MFYIVNNIDSKFIIVQVTKWRKTLQNWFDCSQSKLKLVIVLFLYGDSIHILFTQGLSRTRLCNLLSGSFENYE